MWRYLLILLLVVGCKSSKELMHDKQSSQETNRMELSNFDLTKVDKLFTDIVINTDRKLDFIVFDTSKPLVDNEPPILIKGSLVDNSTSVDRSRLEELVTDNSEVIVEDKGKVNIRDKLQASEKINNKTWIEQLTKFGVVIAILMILIIYIKRRWF